MSRNRTIVVSIVAIAVLAVALFVVPKLLAPASQSPDCELESPNHTDMEQLVAFGQDVFRPPQWALQQQSSDPGMVVAAWYDDVNDGLAHMQMLMFPCGYTQEQIDNFYGPDGFNVMLSGYDSYTETDVCADGDLTLHEFEVGYAGRPYLVRFWVAPVSPTRVRDVHLGFYPEDAALMDEYAEQLFPNLPACA